MRKKSIPVVAPRFVEHYLEMPRSELTLLPADTLGEMACEVLAHCYYLQHLDNENKAKVSWCDAQIDILIGPIFHNYEKVYGSKEKRLLAINAVPDALEWQDQKNAVEASAKITDNLAQRLEAFGKGLLQLETSKRRLNG